MIPIIRPYPDFPTDILQSRDGCLKWKVFLYLFICSLLQYHLVKSNSKRISWFLFDFDSNEKNDRFRRITLQEFLANFDNILIQVTLLEYHLVMKREQSLDVFFDSNIEKSYPTVKLIKKCPFLADSNSNPEIPSNCHRVMRSWNV